MERLSLWLNIILMGVLALCYADKKRVEDTGEIVKDTIEIVEDIL